MGIAEVLSSVAEGTYVQKTRRCDAAGCYELTRENKPFCLEHIELAPYVCDLLRRMEDRDVMDGQVATDHRKASLSSITAQEILLTLRQKGTVTEDSLSRAMKLERQTIHNYALKMLDNNLVLLRVTSRGRTTITLLDASGQPATPTPMDDDDIDEDDE